MDADGCRWVQMMRVGALVYNNDKVGVRWAREGVDMHDLGARVAGKFPDIMLRHILPKKHKNEQQSHITWIKRRINHACNLTKAIEGQQQRKTHTNEQNPATTILAETQKQKISISNLAKNNTNKQ